MGGSRRRAQRTGPKSKGTDRQPTNYQSQLLTSGRRPLDPAGSFGAANGRPGGGLDLFALEGAGATAAVVLPVLLYEVPQLAALGGAGAQSKHNQQHECSKRRCTGQGPQPALRTGGSSDGDGVNSKQKQDGGEGQTRPASCQRTQAAVQQATDDRNARAAASLDLLMMGPLP